jgi:ribonuclease P protein subunit RPR2
MAKYNDAKFTAQKIASERITKLFLLAEQNFREHPELSRRYVQLARNISTRHKTKLTSEQKKLFCKNCNAYLKNGVNSRVRIVKGKIVTTCLGCKNVRRIIVRK